MLLIGVDGGGTRTTAVLAQDVGDGPVAIGRGTGGPSNLRSQPFERATGHIADAIAAAFADARLPQGLVAGCCLALSGAGRAVEQNAITGWARSRLLMDRLLVTHDADSLLAAGVPDGWGIAVIAGTGSFCFGRNQAGDPGRAGGWGYLLGDEGSGYALALDALRTVVAIADGRRRPLRRHPAPKPEGLPAGRTLTAAALDFFQVAEPSGLVQAIYAEPLDRAAIAAFIEPVLRLADEGEPDAQATVSRGVDDLSMMADAVRRSLGCSDAEPTIPLALGGGLWKNDHFRTSFLDRVGKRFSVGRERVVDEPAWGSVLLARRLLST